MMTRLENLGGSVPGRRKSLVCLLTLLIALCAGLVPASVGQAFWGNYHKNITRQALQGLVNAAALEDLVDMSTIGDTGDYNGKSASHYDNCVWDLGKEWIISNRAGAVAAAYQYFTTGEASDRLEMYQRLGLVFHAAQDFYAHSNWIENNDDGVTADLEGAKPSYWLSGTWPHDYPQLAPAGTPTHGELNKDFPLRRGYDEACNDAAAETKKQFALFQAALRTSYPSQAEAILSKVFPGDRDDE